MICLAKREPLFQQLFFLFFRKRSLQTLSDVCYAHGYASALLFKKTPYCMGKICCKSNYPETQM